MSTTKLRELIKDVKVAMFTTVDHEGMIRSRPLETLELPSENDALSSLCFFTAIDTPKVGEIEAEHSVNLSYSDPVHQTYVSVSGKATTSRDRDAIKRFWKPIHKAWFPQGADDPKLALITVRIQQAEYWNAPSGTVVNAIGIAKAIVMGDTYEPGDNEKLRISA